MKDISLRGRTFEGTVISDKMDKTVTVEWERTKLLRKYERTLKARTKVKAHNEVGAKTGDRVLIQESRPISKSKKFVVVKVL
jgi:small subunit ribosomal protein S17